MRIITNLDKLLLTLGFLIVIAIFTLAGVIYVKSGQCVLNPCDFAMSNNITCGFPQGNYLSNIKLP